MNNEKELNKLVEQIGKANNVLVALSQNLSIDELSTALGLTLMLNKNDRRAVTVFSGAIPRVLKFLRLDETFDQTVDGLRDFIITLDAKKADRVVCKAESDMVKVYITPSGQKITPQDLEFSQGDYNVDLVIALGVSDKESLDKALASHGRILHNASVVSLMIGNGTSNLGSVNIRAPKASSYAELIAPLPVLLDENLADDAEPAMDKSVATALLTGLVATTNRFANRHTTPDLLNLASDLMRAGANQQLVASNLAQGNRPKSDGPSISKDKETLDLRQSQDFDQEESAKPKAKPQPKPVRKDKRPPKNDLPSVAGIKIDSKFANLEQYNEEQLALERQRVADDLAEELSEFEPETPEFEAEPELSEDDQLDQQLEQARQDHEKIDELSKLKQNDEQEAEDLVEDRTYLQDPKKAWAQNKDPEASGLNLDLDPAKDTNSYIDNSPRLVLDPNQSKQEEFGIEVPSPPEAPAPVAPVVPPLAPMPEFPSAVPPVAPMPAGMPEAPTPQVLATAPVVPEAPAPAPAVAPEPSPAPEAPAPLDITPPALPQMPDFSSMVPPTPPAMPNFGPTPPPLPPFPNMPTPQNAQPQPWGQALTPAPAPEAPAPAPEVPAPAPVAPLAPQPAPAPVAPEMPAPAPALASAPAPTPLATELLTTTVFPDQQSQAFPATQGPIAPMTSPVMADQIYPQPIDNAQFIIPE